MTFSAQPFGDSTVTKHPVTEGGSTPQPTPSTPTPSSAPVPPSTGSPDVSIMPVLGPPDQTAADYLRSVLDQYGLGSLSQWAMDQLIAGNTQEQVLQSMRKTPEFIARFPAISYREQNGLAPISPSEYIEYEQRARQMMYESGLPPGFYDQPADFTSLINKDVSLAELQTRIQQGYQQVTTTPPEVRQVFQQYYGAGTDSALAMFYLDPDRAEPQLLEQAKSAVFGGTAKRFGFDVSEGISRLAAQQGLSSDAIQQGFASLAQQKGLFDETIGEKTNLQAEVEGVQAQFGQNAQAADAVRRRQEKRQGDFSGYETPVTTQQGIQGLGSAKTAGR